MLPLILARTFRSNYRKGGWFGPLLRRTHDQTIVRAHHESAGLAVSGEVPDALELVLIEEKGVPLDQQVSVLQVTHGQGLCSSSSRRAGFLAGGGG